ncbi:MAG: metallophosphoesterase [Eubacteriales bacterium]|nr:metallophosphoesterase [Eubacteriales bacterium]
MRIALIGDLQYRKGEEAAVEKYMEQIAAWKPELAVSMGDMGSGREAGTKEAMLQCRAFLDRLPCETIVLLGNHDVEYRPDDDTRLRRQEEWYTEVFGAEKPYAAWECAGAFLLCMSAQRQPQELLLSQHALYASPEQMDWAGRQLRAHRDRPTIVLSHAPCAGSGLRCCPPVHHAATDAYMGQNFDPHAWRRLLKENPQIFLWGSAHFHMGHGYARAITVRDGTTHFSCGVMCSCARDGTRQTRLMEIEEDGAVALYTMDHLAGGKITRDARIRAGDTAQEQRSVLIGEDKALCAWDAPALRRSYIATQAGRLWEYDEELQELTGMLCAGEHAQALSVFCGRIYVQTEEGVFSVPMDSQQRFARLSGFVPRCERKEKALPCEPLATRAFRTQREAEGEYIELL